jgi:subtilisin family serine protease
MSKSKSKSKSKQASFPDQYWQPEFEIYTHYPALFEHGKELLEVMLDGPPENGDTIDAEVKELLRKQENLDERRREEIKWEMDHLSRGYQAALLTGPDAYPKTWQLINTMADLALVPVMHFKKKFARPRPNQIEPRIEPLIDVPGHPAYPSGHSTQNFLIAHVLSEVIGDDAELIGRIFAIARRVAENREWAGVHYSSDTQAGEQLARGIFPIMKQAFEKPIKDAIKEWQELELEEGRKAMHAGAPDERAKGREREDDLSISLFYDHQWNLANRGQTGGTRGVDINVRGAWEQLGIWQGGPPPTKPIRVALIDLAIDFEHPALEERLELKDAVNLDYPQLAKEDPGYVEAFGSFSSAHATACAGIIAADKPLLTTTPDGSTEQLTERGCLGIAPHCRIIPFRAMVLTEPVLYKRQVLARAVLQAATGYTFENPGAGQNGPVARWKVGDKRGRADLLLFPLPLEPLPEECPDPLPLALAFAASKIPVIIPSGNRGTSSLSYPGGSEAHVKPPESLDRLAELFDLDLDSVRVIFGTDDREILKGLISGLGAEAPIIWVGACNHKGERSRYSQYGEGLTVVAPSDDVLPPHEKDNGPHPPSIATTDLKGIGGYMQDDSNYTLSDNEFGFGGTSAAAAQVAGVVALVLQARPGLKPDKVYQFLCETARIRDEQGKTLLLAEDNRAPSKRSAEFGHGLVDAARAVEMALGKASEEAASESEAA